MTFKFKNIHKAFTLPTFVLFAENASLRSSNFAYNYLFTYISQPSKLIILKYFIGSFSFC